jgi:hypothetical protein
MENSGRPETSEFAAKMAELCDGPVIFHNLDVMWEDTGDGAGNGWPASAGRLTGRGRNLPGTVANPVRHGCKGPAENNLALEHRIQSLICCSQAPVSG